MGIKLEDEIRDGNATHIQRPDEHARVLYRTVNGQVQGLNLGRIGRGLKNPPQIDEWYRSLHGKWVNYDSIPVDNVLWPAVPIDEFFGG